MFKRLTVLVANKKRKLRDCRYLEFKTTVYNVKSNTYFGQRLHNRLHQHLHRSQLRNLGICL